MSFSGLSLRDFEYLDAVARRLHFGRAAAECGVSQPALSAQIKKLESVIGIQVFERSPRRVLVTAKGQEILVRTRNILREAHALFEQGREHSTGLSGPFRIGALPTLGPYLLPSLIEPLRQAWPKLDLIISEDYTDALISGLRKGEYDAILLCGHIGESGLAFQHLFFEPFVILHQPQSSAGWPMEETDAPVILLREGHCLRGQVHDACRRDRVYSARDAQSLEMLRFMAAAGEGVSLVPALAARALERPDGLTVSSPIPDPAIGRPAIGRDVVLASRRSDQRQFYIEHLTKLIRSLVPALMQEAQINCDGTPDPPANRASGLKYDKKGIV